MNKEQFRDRCIEVSGSIYVKIQTIKKWKTVAFADLPRSLAEQYIERWWQLRQMPPAERVIACAADPPPDVLWREISHVSGAPFPKHGVL